MLHLKGCTANSKLVQKREMVFIVLLFSVQIANTKSGLFDDFWNDNLGTTRTEQVATSTITMVSTTTENYSTNGPSGSSNGSCGIPSEGSNKLDHTLQEANMKFLTKVDKYEPYIDEPRDLCTSLMAYIMTQANYMLQQAMFLADIALENNRTFEILKEGYKIELAQFAAIINNLNKDHREEISAIENGFSSKFIQFQKNISDSLDQQDNLVVLKKEAVFELCVYKIRIEEYQSALALFKKLGNNSLLTKTVINAYGGNIYQLSNVIKFIKVAESCDHQALAYQALFDEIKINDHLSHPNLLFFSDLIEECISESLKNELKEYKTNIIKGLVYEYKLEKMNEALDFEKKYPTDEVSVKFEIYSTLFDELESHGHLDSKELIALAYRFKHLDDFCEGKADECKYLKPKLSSMKLRFPSGLKALLFNPHVVIESMGHPGYTLYASNEGQVYTLPNSNSSNQKWLARPLTGDNYLELKNVLDPGYLYFIDSTLHYGSRRPWEIGNCHWEVIPNGFGSYYLKNTENGKFLDANSLESCSWSGTRFCSRVSTRPFEDGLLDQLWNFS